MATRLASWQLSDHESWYELRRSTKIPIHHSSTPLCVQRFYENMSGLFCFWMISLGLIDLTAVAVVLTTLVVINRTCIFVPSFWRGKSIRLQFCQFKRVLWYIAGMFIIMKRLKHCYNTVWQKRYWIKHNCGDCYNDGILWKRVPDCWPSVRRNHQWPVDSLTAMPAMRSFDFSLVLAFSKLD